MLDKREIEFLQALADNPSRSVTDVFVKVFKLNPRSAYFYRNEIDKKLKARGRMDTILKAWSLGYITLLGQPFNKQKEVV